MPNPEPILHSQPPHPSPAKTRVPHSFAAPSRKGGVAPAPAEGETTNQIPPRIAVAGVSGYAGAELARLLLRHPAFRGNPPIFLGRLQEPDAAPPEHPAPLTQLHPQLAGLPGTADSFVHPWTWDELARAGIGLLFLATPHEQARAWAPVSLAHGIRVVDLSGAWRLRDPANRAVYNFEDPDPALAERTEAAAVYGSPELHGPAIAGARLVANPGCYATSIILALAPLLLPRESRAGLVDLDCGVICDAKSGVSGAGKKATATTHFMYAADNLSAYAVFGHRHTGEWLEQLKLSPDQIQFTPHLLPIPRGILSTVYVKLREPRSPQQIQALFDGFYSAAPLVRVHRSPALPQIQHVVRTAFADLGFQLSPNGKRLVIVSCLDNLLKGAASQAVQNMNLMLGLPETEGLL